LLFFLDEKIEVYFLDFIFYFRFHFLNFESRLISRENLQKIFLIFISKCLLSYMQSLIFEQMCFELFTIHTFNVDYNLYVTSREICEICEETAFSGIDLPIWMFSDVV